jgi:BirA family transcriptional regulator, biotin operon repressor / biotin---[acetyl-CoA-carboxylase] ligase
MAKAIKEQIIQTLAQGSFVSGQQLGEKLGVSRAAISNHVKSLTDIGLDVFRVTGKGYKLAQPLVLLDQQKILTQLSKLSADAVVVENPLIEVHSIIDSTNSYLLRKIPNQISKGQSCVAEYQQAGRGRRGRQWLSPFGSHVYLSLYWPLEQGMAQAMGLSLVIALALSDAISKYSNADIQLKWPNDIYIAGKKVAGILVELEGQAQGLSHCVIGVGVNVQMPPAAAEQIDQPWTDLHNHVAETIDRNKLVAEIIHHIYSRLKQQQNEGFGSMLAQWHEKDIFLNKAVKIMTGAKETYGIYRGVNDQGAMLLETAGTINPIYGGEVSLRSVE